MKTQKEVRQLLNEVYENFLYDTLTEYKKQEIKRYISDRTPKNTEILIQSRYDKLKKLGTTFNGYKENEILNFKNIVEIDVKLPHLGEYITMSIKSESIPECKVIK